MSKTGETKRKICGLLSEKRLTALDISQQLNISQATVCQHLHELLAYGYVRIYWNGTRYRYYEVAR